MSHQNIWEKNGLYRIFTGKISGKEVMGSNLASHGNAHFDTIKYVISDFTQITEFEVSDDDISIIATIDNIAVKSNAELKIAIVVTLESLKIWVQLYCEKMQDSPYECKIFNSIGDARKWVS